MKQFISTLPANFLNCFKGWNLIWHLTAIVFTIILVMSGFDWQYFKATANPVLRFWMFPAALVGFFVPICLPPILWLIGVWLKNASLTLAAFAVAQAEILGSFISSACKAFTGRAHPIQNGAEDISRIFHFGFLRGGMFWGWPSSHATIAFAMAFTLCRLFPNQRLPGIAAVAYAGYIGVGISMTIHWFSDFIAGAMVGTAIGLVVGKCFYIIQAANRTQLA